MEWVRRGKGWTFGDNIIPDDALAGREPLNELLSILRPTDRDLSQNCMIGYDPDFPQKAAPGDLIVAGRNFGFVRAHQPFFWSLQHKQVGGIIAESFQPRFVVTAAMSGVLCLECPGVKDFVSPGDELLADFKTGRVENLTTGQVLQGTGLPESLTEIVELGHDGYLRSRVARSQQGTVPVRGLAGSPAMQGGPQTATEKVLARGAGVPRVERGQLIYFEPDLYIAHEHYVYPDGAEAMKRYGVSRLWNPDKVMVVYDHDTTPSLWRDRQHGGRRWVQEMGVEKFFDIGWGLSHQIAAELGYVRPGMLVTNHDPNLVSYAAQGAVAVTAQLGPSQMHIEMICTGSMWLVAPDPVKVVVEGELGPGVSPRDLFTHVVNQVGIDAFFGKTVEFAGSTVSAMSIDERMTLCNQIPGVGAVNAWIEPDEKTIAWVDAHGDRPYEVVRNDPGVTYTKVWEFDASQVEPLVSPPPDPILTARPVKEYEGVRVSAGFIGSCLGGRLDELHVAAQILKGKKLAPYTRLMVTPISKDVMRQAQTEGLIDVFLDAGAIWDVPGCGACWGAKFLLSGGENCITNATANIKGRMGSADATIYLGNAAVVAASCLEGRITDPRPYLS